MADEGLEGVARDASTMLDVLRAFEQRGFTGQFAACADGEIECMQCKQRTHASAVHNRHLRRLEGASDPDDLLAVAALVCPSCGSQGTLVLNYGPSATPEDASVLRHLESPPPTPDVVDEER